MHYSHFNIADYRKDTGHLTMLEHAIYRALIDQYYLDEQPISLETQSVMRRLRLVSEEEAKALINVLSDFFYESDGWRHKRIDQDIIEYHAMSAKNKKNGKLGGRPKKTQSVNSGLPLVTQTKGNQEPITNNQVIKPLSNPDGFDEFWFAYPKKVGKGEAKKLWAKLKVNGRLPSVLSAIAAQKSTAQWQKEGGQFIPLPATWLRQGRWDDEVQQVTPQWNMFAGAI